MITKAIGRPIPTALPIIIATAKSKLAPCHDMSLLLLGSSFHENERSIASRQAKCAWLIRRSSMPDGTKERPRPPPGPPASPTLEKEGSKRE
jgi:hypothetical protein